MKGIMSDEFPAALRNVAEAAAVFGTASNGRRIAAGSSTDPSEPFQPVFADQPYTPNRKARRAQEKVDRKAPVLQYVGKTVLQ